MANNLRRAQYMRLYYLLLCAVLPVMGQAQRFTFGVKGGVPAQTPLGQTGSGMPFVLGPTVNIRILSQLSLETGVLFHRMGQPYYSWPYRNSENGVSVFSGTEHGRALDLPFLAKCYIRAQKHVWRPFVTLGPTVRRTYRDGQYYTGVFTGASSAATTAQTPLSWKIVKWNVDPALGAGIDIKTGRFHLEPEARYSYWSAGKSLGVRKNQVEFLLGLRF